MFDKIRDSDDVQWLANKDTIVALLETSEMPLSSAEFLHSHGVKFVRIYYEQNPKAPLSSWLAEIIGIAE